MKKQKARAVNKAKVVYCVNLERITHPNKVHQPFFLMQLHVVEPFTNLRFKQKDKNIDSVLHLNRSTMY